jgi:PAS domain-containing protein
VASNKIKQDPLNFNARVLPDYAVQIDMNRKYLEVSDGFCKLLGYSRTELIGKRLDEVIAPQTTNIPLIFDLFLQIGYMHGIWILLNRSHTTRILVRYEAWLQKDRRIECNMELLGAGA